MTFSYAPIFVFTHLYVPIIYSVTHGICSVSRKCMLSSDKRHSSIFLSVQFEFFTSNPKPLFFCNKKCTRKNFSWIFFWVLRQLDKLIPSHAVTLLMKSYILNPLFYPPSSYVPIYVCFFWQFILDLRGTVPFPA